MRLELLGTLNGLTVKGRMSPTPGLAVTRVYGANGRSTHVGYRVTHVGSLKAIKPDRTLSYSQAKAIATLLYHATNWTNAEDTILAERTRLQGVVDRIFTFVCSDTPSADQATIS